VPIYLKDGLGKTEGVERIEDLAKTEGTKAIEDQAKSEGMEEIGELLRRSISSRMEFVPNGVGARELSDVARHLENLPSEIGL
jgi:hypothetical protein